MREGETTTALPEAFDAGLYFIGRIHTPWTERQACPRQGDAKSGPVCTLQIDPHWREALNGIEQIHELQVLYWMDQARRDLVTQMPGKPEAGRVSRSTFTLRSPARPNPIASSHVTLLEADGLTLKVRGLDCVNDTPLLDLKPLRSRSTQIIKSQKIYYGT
ncbi:MAG: tRNA (N6-threonylcarbamoyladenosine(37)-N6)-methyltransferase TrmO [Xanthobacter sp.]